MSTDWHRFFSSKRFDAEGNKVPSAPEDIRSSPSRDWDRIVFSESFRRLHDKTQVFPLNQHDTVHSRLTHSLEVASVGRSLGNLAGAFLQGKSVLPYGWDPRVVGDVVAAACLAHDIGNPPFGHSGEDAIGAFFRRHLTREVCARFDITDEQKIDLQRFEGNAQGLRILARTGMRDSPGMRLTATTVAAFMKYPRPSGADLLDDAARGPRPAHRKKFGAFQSEKAYLETIAGATGMIRDVQGPGWKRHPLCWLVEASDDICYRILDLEDGVRLKLIPKDVAQKVLFAAASAFKGEGDPRDDDPIGRLRAYAINRLLRQVGKLFEERWDAIASGEMTQSLTDDPSCKTHLDALKKLVEKHCYVDERVLDVELAGYDIVGAILGRAVPAALMFQGSPETEKKPAQRRLDDVDEAFAGTALRSLEVTEARKLLARLDVLAAVRNAATPYDAILSVTDYVSGMTDSYAVSLYRHLAGISLPGSG